MADKFIIHGATFNGDGTSSAEATVNGGVGAWNNINVFEGTAPAFGALAAGDTVYIRSKGSSGSDITRTLTASVNLGTAAATLGANVVWVIDAGVVWPGVSGVITYTHAAAWLVTIRANNHVIAATKGAFVIRNTSTNQAAGMTVLSLLGRADNLTLDWSAKTGIGECVAALLGDDSVLEAPTINWGRIGGAATATRGLVRMANSSVRKATVIAPSITMSDSNVGLPIFYSGDSARGLLTVIGGEITGPGATSGQPLYAAAVAQARFRSIGLRFPRTMDVVAPTNVGFTTAPGEIEVIGCDDGVGGHIEREWGFATSRTDSNPPTLQATLPDSGGSPWSWRVYPKAPTNSDPMHLTSVKMFTGASAAKTITQEVLVADTMASNAWNLWVTVEYQDATTGAMKHVSSRDVSAGALAASTANWSATVWGAVTFNKRKLSIATPTAVKQDTPIVVTLWGTLAAASANDIFFVDPDFGVV